jgi:drug/metabolite transporter (DMT)-like permease
MLYFLAPVITGVLAVLMLGETLTAPLLVAAGVILGGVYLAQRQ